MKKVFIDGSVGTTGLRISGRLAKRADIELVSLPEEFRKAMISKASQGWNLRRIGKAELNILRVAVYEMYFDDEVPVSVAINEAVELAHEFGGDQSHAFVNGILSAVWKNNPADESKSAAEETPKD